MIRSERWTLFVIAVVLGALFCWFWLHVK